MQTIKFIAFGICLIFLTSSHSYADEIYKWVDKNGVVHLTNHPGVIPKEYKSSVKKSVSKDESRASIEKIKGGSKNAFDEALKFLEENREKIQIGIPLIVGLIALIYPLRRYLKIKGQRERQKRLRALELLNVDDMDGTEFERYIIGLLANGGFKIEKTGDSINLGVDFIARKNNLKYAVQIRRQTGPVSRIAISDIERERHRYDCDRGMLITNGYFTKDAIELAESKGCELIDRDTLARWILDFQKSNNK
jgi:restriction system protein